MKKTFYVLALFASAVGFTSCSDADATTPQETATPSEVAAAQRMKPATPPTLQELTTSLANAQGAALQAEEAYKVAHRAAMLRFQIRRELAVKRYWERKANELR